MRRNPWMWIGPTLIVIVALFIVVSYLYNQKVHMTVVSHMPEPSGVPGVSAYTATLTASEAGKSFLRVWEATTRRLQGVGYDVEVRLNDANFFRALAAFEGRTDRNAEDRYNAYNERYRFERNPVFTVVMHAPKGGLFDTDDPKRLMVLRADSGEEHEPETWSDSNRSMEYHREAVVTFGRDDRPPILGPETRAVELVWRDPAIQGERRAVWNLGPE